MAFIEPELLPEEVGLAEALPQLFLLAGLIVALGMIEAASGLVDFINWTIKKALGPFGFLGGVVSFVTGDILQPLSNALGSWEGAIDNQMAASFHKLASIVLLVGQEIAGLGTSIYHLGFITGTLLHRLIHSGAVQEAASESIAAVERTASHAEARANQVAGQAAAVEAAAAARVASVEAAVAGVIEHDIPSLRDLAAEAEHKIQAGWDVIKEHEQALAIGGITAAVAVALAELDASYIRCESNKTLGKAVCGAGPQNIENLLGLLGAGLLVGNFRSLIEAAQSVEHDTAEVIQALLQV